jgi:guanylate cyclase
LTRANARRYRRLHRGPERRGEAGYDHPQQGCAYSGGQCDAAVGADRGVFIETAKAGFNQFCAALVGRRQSMTESGPQRSGVVRRLARIGAVPTDTPEQALRKEILVMGSVLTTVMAFVWVGTYWALGLRLSATIPLVYQIASITNLTILARTKREGIYVKTDLTLTLLLPFVLQLSLGGFLPSSGVVLWSFLAPLNALMYYGHKGSLRWFLAFTTVAGLSGALDPLLTNQAVIPHGVVILFFVLNVLGVTGSAFSTLHYFVTERERYATALNVERERSERLLLNVLPEPIAARLKSGERWIADARPEVGVLFADIAGFTPMSERATPDEVVRLLDDVFSTFDELATRYGLEKIKTIGDAYMVASGLLDSEPTHSERLADMALAMREEIGRRGQDLSLRIGIDIGPVVAGVIGRSKFIYDLWGDTVNTASRMESHGIPGRIQVTESVRNRLAGEYRFEARGTIDVKGKGPMTTFMLIGRAAPADAFATDAYGCSAELASATHRDASE